MSSAKTKHDQELQALLSAGNWKKVVQSCETYEQEAANETPSASTLPNYGVHLLSYLLINDLNNARFLWKRIPSSVKTSKPELAAIWKIGKALWNKDYAELYKAFNSYNWTDVYKVLVTALLDSSRLRTFALLSKAYTVLSVADASAYLGLPPDEVVNLSAPYGWTFDASTKLLHPKPVKEEKIQSTGTDQLQQLTEYFCYLESQ